LIFPGKIFGQTEDCGLEYRLALRVRFAVFLLYIPTWSGGNYKWDSRPADFESCFALC